jgi:hypothetical protein
VSVLQAELPITPAAAHEKTGGVVFLFSLSTRCADSQISLKRARRLVPNL